MDDVSLLQCEVEQSLETRPAMCGNVQSDCVEVIERSVGGNEDGDGQSGSGCQLVEAGRRSVRFWS